ncbi:hypothetical protein [Halomonas sp. WWR20]
MPVKPSRHHGATRRAMPRATTNRRATAKPDLIALLRQPQRLDRLLDLLVVVSVVCALVVGAMALCVMLLRG